MARASMRTHAWVLPALLLAVLHHLALPASGAAVPDASLLAVLLEEARAPGVRDFMLTARCVCVPRMRAVHGAGSTVRCCLRVHAMNTPPHAS
jgi:hypothetical protein